MALKLVLFFGFCNLIFDSVTQIYRCIMHCQCNTGMYEYIYKYYVLHVFIDLRIATK